MQTISTLTPEKNWEVKFFYEKKIQAVQISALRSIDARRQIKSRFSPCTILTVTEYSDESQQK